MRDLGARLGYRMIVEDSWGGDVTTAAIAHLAASTPAAALIAATDFNSYITVSTAEGAPSRKDGFMSASAEPGLGVRLKESIIGKPVAVYGKK